MPRQLHKLHRRSDALERRRAMMEAWASYCYGGAKVVRIAVKALL